MLNCQHSGVKWYWQEKAKEQRHCHRDQTTVEIKVTVISPEGIDLYSRQGPEKSAKHYHRNCLLNQLVDERIRNLRVL